MYRSILILGLVWTVCGCGASPSSTSKATTRSTGTSSQPFDTEAFNGRTTAGSHKLVPSSGTPDKTPATSSEFVPPPYPDFENPGKDAEPLPPLPKADPKSTHQALNQEKTLYLETIPDGKRRVLVQAEVCMTRGPLEVFLCKSGTKEHEAIVSTKVDPQFIHASLVAAGAEPGTPVQFVDPKTGDEQYRPATGAKIRVLVNYTKGGKTITRPAQEWIRDIPTEKPMTHEWVFAGSRLVKNPDRPDDPPYYTANNGEIISISNFPDSMLELPVSISRDNADLSFEARTVEIPPLLSKVWVILEPVAAKKAAK